MQAVCRHYFISFNILFSFMIIFVFVCVFFIILKPLGALYLMGPYHPEGQLMHLEGNTLFFTRARERQRGGPHCLPKQNE